MKTWDAIGIGLVVRDVSVLLDRYPEPDTKVPSREIHDSGGGPVPTALVTLARLGRRTALSGLVGADAVGELLASELSEEGVDTRGVAARSDFETATSVILIESGRRTILEAPRSVGFPLPWEDASRLPLDDAKALLVDARAVDVQLRAAEQVRGAGGIVVLDCGHPRDGVEELLERTDVAIFSHTYPRTLHGEHYDLRDFLAEVASKLPEGPRIAGVTLGASGCAIRDTGGELLHLEGLPVDALDTTGAGDVFHGAFVHAYLETRSVLESAAFANVAAARKCEGMTGRAPLPDESALWRQSRESIRQKKRG